MCNAVQHYADIAITMRDIATDTCSNTARYNSTDNDQYDQIIDIDIYDNYCDDERYRRFDWHNNEWCKNNNIAINDNIIDDNESTNDDDDDWNDDGAV